MQARLPRLRLNTTGFAHHLVAAVIVVVAALAGTYAVIDSHAASNPYVCTNPRPTIQEGSTGSCVDFLQWQLTYIYNYTTHGIDGDFGPNTRAAVVDFQGHNGLSTDGIVGPLTWAKVGGVTSTAPKPVDPPKSGTPVAPPTNKPAPIKVVAGGTPTPTTIATPPAKTTSTTASAANATGCATPAPQLEEGSTGNCVKVLQEALGLNPVDGDFGPATLAAVKNYQTAIGLSVDGIVGPCTWGSIGINGGSTSACPAHTSAAQQATIEEVSNNLTKTAANKATTSVGNPTAVSQNNQDTHQSTGSSSIGSTNNQKNEGHPSVVSTVVVKPIKKVVKVVTGAVKKVYSVF